MDTKKRRKSRTLTVPAAPSSSRRRRCEDNVDERREWASLPRDVLCMVLRRLRRQTDILGGAGLACSHWRRVAREEPLLWRHIDLSDGHSWQRRPPTGWKAMARVAVDGSAGRCESFIGHVDADVLLHLANSAPLLTQLSVARWPSFPGITEIVVKKLPLLKRLALWSDELQEELLLILPMCEGWEEPIRTRIRSGIIDDLLAAEHNLVTSQSAFHTS